MAPLSPNRTAAPASVARAPTRLLFRQVVAIFRKNLILRFYVAKKRCETLMEVRDQYQQLDSASPPPDAQALLDRLVPRAAPAR